jgi:hypothetical protein
MVLSGVGGIPGFASPSASPPARTAGLHPFAATIQLSPTSGKVGTKVTVSGGGFGSGATITISFDGAAVATTPTTCTATSSGKTGGGGNFSCNIHAPAGRAGANTVSATDGTSTATAPFYEKDLISTSPSGVDVGQNATATGAGFGTVLAITAFTLDGIPLTCTSASNGSTCYSGAITTNGTGGFTVTFLVPTVAVSGPYTIEANDSAGASWDGSVTVYVDPTVGAITASLPSADLQEPVTFNATVSNGSGGFGYVWSGLPGCSGASDPLRCTATDLGVATIRLMATDSNGIAAISPTFVFTVNDDPTVTAPTANVSTVDVNQSVTFTTTAASGSGAYSSYNWAGLPSGCIGITASVACVPRASGTWDISVSVTDSVGWTSAAQGLSFPVDPDPSVAAPVANRTAADVGQSVTFSASASEGSGGYAYDWIGVPSDCSSETSQLVCAMTAAGTYVISVVVADSNGYRTASAPLTFHVSTLPTVSLLASPLAVDAGQRVAFNATASGGSGGTSYTWTGLPTGCTGTSANVSCLAGLPGTYSATVRVRDSNGGVDTSKPVVVVVAAPLVANPPTYSAGPVAGAAVTFTASSSGGTAPVSYAWHFGDGSTGTGATVPHIYVVAGTYSATVWVNDSAGASVPKTVSLTVAAPPTPQKNTTASGPSPALLGAAGAGIVIVVVAVTLLLLVRRRKSHSSQSDASDASPPTQQRGDEPQGGQ